MPITEYFRTQDGRSRIMMPDSIVQMYGPAFDGSGELVNREVAERDVLAYQRIGYKFGSIEEKPKEVAPEAEVAPEPVVKRSKKKK